MPWGSIRGHDQVVETLRAVMHSGRVPHALIFAGPEGIGKNAFATRLAQALLCTRSPEHRLEPCGQCPSCLQVQAGSHPDLLRVAKPEDRSELPIQAMRELCRDLGLKPMSGHRRIAIIEDAQTMSDEAANAFLKTLEEPPPGAVLILLTTSTELMLDTILSRCRVIRFEPLNESDLADVLIDKGLATSPQEARRLAHWGDGSVERALGLADPSFLKARRELLDALAHPNGFDPSALARDLNEFIQEAGKEATLRRRRAALLLDELARFFRGVLWCNAGLVPPTPDPDDRAAIERLGTRLEPEIVFLLAERCLEAHYQLERMAYLPALWDALACDFDRLLHASASKSVQ